MQLTKNEKMRYKDAQDLISCVPNMFFEESAKSVLGSLLETIDRLCLNPNMSCEGCICEHTHGMNERCKNCIRGKNQPDLHLRRNQ